MNLTELLNSDMNTLWRAAQQGVDWWLRELRAMVPRGLGGGEQRISAFHELGPDDRVIAAPPGRRSPDTLVIPGEICLVRHIALPAMREADLRALVELDADRILPVAADALVIGVRAGGVAAGQPNLIDVAVGALPRARAQHIAARLAEAGIAPLHIGPLGASGESLAFDLAPAMRSAGLLPQRPPVARFWWSAVAILVAICFGIAVLRDQQQVDKAQAMVDSQAPALGAVRRIEGRLIGNQRRIKSLQARREHQQPLRVLVRLGAALPAKSWLQRLEWDGNQIRVSGYSTKDVNVIAAVKDSGAFTAVRAGRAEALSETIAGKPFDFSASVREKR